jgi:Domain of unknown function (DUF4349)
MPRLDFPAPDAEILEALEAIDATLAGEAVDPRHAELAELALLLRDERPVLPAAFSASLDERVADRFGRQPAVRQRRPRLSGWLLAPAVGLAASLIVAIVIVVSEGSHRTAPPQTQASAASGAALPSRAAKVPAQAARGPVGSADRSGVAATAPSTAATATTNQELSPNVPALQPPSNGRRIVQGAQLALTTRPARIDTVAQEVFDVAGRFNAVVQNSSVTAVSGPGGYAQFQLSIPSAALGQAMSALSSLPYARVASRTDSTQDVNNQYQSDVRALADARARRTAILRQLAAATTQEQIQSLTAQLHDAEASISSDEATLRVLNHQIGYSQVSITINGATQPVPLSGSGHGFTLGTAAHDAGRVLTVAAGVAIIGLAALTPVALLAALGWWILWGLRRRRREHALDLV